MQNNGLNREGFDTEIDNNTKTITKFENNKICTKL